MRFRQIILTLLFFCAGFLHAAGTITSAEALYRTIFEQNVSSGAFDITARVNLVAQEKHVAPGTEMTLIVEDSAGINLFGRADEHSYKIRAGDLVHATGRIVVNSSGKRFPQYERLTILRRGEPPAPVDTTVARLLSGALDFRLVRFRAVVRDASPSPTHPSWAILGLVDNGHIIGAPILIEHCDFKSITPLVGQEIEVTGCCTPNDLSSVYAGRQFHIYNTNRIHVVENRDRRLRPLPVTGLGSMRPADYDELGLHVVTGTVVASWNKNRLLLAGPGGMHVFASVRQSRLPALGADVEVIGFPESNFYNINLRHAQWNGIDRPSSTNSPETACAVSLPSLFDRQWDTLRPPNRHMTGKLVRTRGKILTLPSNDGTDRRFLTDGTNSVVVETGLLTDARRELVPGCEAEITGICVCEVEPHLLIQPTFRNIFLIPRHDGDIRILVRPSWWTPGRLTAAIAVLFALLVIIWLRNLLQRRTADLLARTTTALRVAERTRLAVELHDSLAQNLTGVSMKIDAARKASGTPDKMAEDLQIASKALLSCRAELRNCLWDLRHQTLEIDNMESAVRQTLEPHLDGADLSVRFHMQRKSITDNTAHAILCMIRELTINAVRHGRATDIKVAGSVEQSKLLISVRDNGCGFDPETCPNDDQGHYGLLGIRERINTFEGALTIDSHPGKGTKVTIALNIPHDET